MLLDAFLKFESPVIAGESTDAKNLAQIEILSFEQTVVRAQSSTGVVADATPKGRAQHSALTIIKPLDKSSPKLFEAACKGTLYAKVTMSVCQPLGKTNAAASTWKKQVYFEITLEQVHVSRVHLVGEPKLHSLGLSVPFSMMAGSTYDVGPLEEIDLTYQKIKWDYKGGTGVANVTGTWSLLANTAP